MYSILPTSITLGLPHSNSCVTHSHTQGLGGFYAGMGTYIFCDGVAGSIKFATYEALKKYTKKNVKEEYYGAALFGCAAAAFIASSFVLVPGELIKQRLQNGDYTSLANGISTIFKNEGCGGFYTGYAAVCFRDVPYTMLELGLYDNLKSAYLFFKNRSNKKGGKSYEITQADEIVCAALTGGITGYVTNPLDSIKTKIVLDGSMYSGFMDCFRQSVAAGGVGSLFNGGAARVSWLMPFTAIYLPIYETLKRSFASSRTDKAKAKGWRLASGGGRGGGGMGVGGVLGEGGQKREGVCFVNTSEANANAKC